MSLKIEGLSAAPGSRPVLHGVDLEVEARDRVALLGPSGGGKTTLLRAVAGLLRPMAGTIAVGGRRVFGPDVDVPPARRNVGLVFQSYALWPHLTVRQHLQLVAGRRNPRVAALLGQMRLAPLGDRVPGQLSGGEQARLALARALVASPQLLMMDEPFRNLDPPLARSLRQELLAALHEQAITLLFVTHDHREAFSLARQVHVLDEGAIVASGSPAELYRRPQTAALARFLGRSMRLPVDTYQDGRARTVLGPAAVAAGTRSRALLVRPEDLSLEQDTDGNGEVLRTTFEGASALVHLEVGGEEFVARVAADQIPTPGQRLRVALAGELPPWPEGAP